MPCSDHIAQDARTAALLWHELLDRMMPSGPGFTDVVTTTPERGLRLDPRAVRARHNIREALCFWATYVTAGRGFPLPPVAGLSVEGLADHIGHTRNLTWLCSQDFAVRAAAELHELAWGEPMRIARPSGTRSRPLGPCPEKGCDGYARAILRPPDSPRGSIAECTEGHWWPPEEWAKKWPPVAPESPLVGMDVATLVLKVSPDSVRQLVATGRLARYGEPYRAEFRLTDLDELHDELWPVSV
jgi:hypothetical protein